MKKTPLTDAQVQQIIEEILAKHTRLTKQNGHYEGEAYVDYRDELAESQLRDISNYEGENKLEYIYDLLQDVAIEAQDYEIDSLIKLVSTHWDENVGCYAEYEEVIRDTIENIVQIIFPYEHYLNQTVYVNILVDTGDGNYDFTMNNFISYNSTEEEEIEDESSILWLVQKQGYSKEQLMKAVREGDYQGSNFLESIVDECINVTTHMNALSFFVKMTLEQFIDLTDNKKSITLGKNTACGLYDCWSGAGGTLEIALEKDITLPHDLIHPHIDGARGYGIDSIYAMSRSFWTDSVLAITYEETN